jgi:hypothetical protein
VVSTIPTIGFNVERLFFLFSNAPSCVSGLEAPALKLTHCLSFLHVTNTSSVRYLCVHVVSFICVTWPS